MPAHNGVGHTYTHCGDSPQTTVTVPVLVINNSADDACTPSHAKRLYEAVSHDDKTFYEVKGATHYYQDQPELGAEAAGVVKNWLNTHGFTV